MPNAATGGYFSEATVAAGAVCVFGASAGWGFHKRANRLCFGLSRGAADGVVDALATAPGAPEFAVITTG